MKTFRLPSAADLFSIPIERVGGAAFITLPVLPEGTFQHSLYGELNWTAERFARMIANLDARVTGYQPMLNADHATHNPFAAASPALGWIVSLEYRAGEGLFARVELTDLGIEGIEKKRYRYTSAEVTSLYVNSKGEEFQDVICGLAMTNTPFHDSMPGTFSRPTVDAALVAQFAQELQAFATLEGDLSFEEIRCLVSDAVRAEVEDVPNVYRWLEDCFSGFCVYEQWSYVGNRETEKHYKRSFTVNADRSVTLADDAVEVEEVWVTVARQAFSAARHQVQRLGATAPPIPAVDPATERKSMSQAAKPTFRSFVLGLFGLKADATPEQLSAALDSAPAPAAEPAEDNPNDTTLSQPSAEVTVLRQQVEEQRKAFAKLQEERAAEQLTLAKAKAEDAVQAYVSQGKITPAMLEGERGEALREFARTNPTQFAAIYDVAPQLVPLNKPGRVDVPAGGGEGSDETFLSAVGALTAKGAEFSAACDEVATARPALYAAYKAANRRGGK